MSLRALVLEGAKWCGGFWLADRARRAGLPILCYHGFSLADEHLFRPALFIRQEAFERRLQWLQRGGYTVIPLAEAIRRLDQGVLGKREAVITIDDGFYSVGAIGWPLLKKYGMPATLYATTYYSRHHNPIFRLAIQYFFWRTKRSDARLDDLAPAQARGRDAMWPLIRWAERALSEDGRCELARKVAARLEVDYEELRASRRLSLLTEEELRSLAGEGLDLQLHTHRHNLPEEGGAIARELADNRRALHPLTAKPLSHFCYPSGVWSERHWQVLASHGIESAATCMPGFNEAHTPRLALLRFLDSEELGQRDFEAELTGFKTFLRSLRAPQ